MHTKITKKLLNVIDETNVEACLILFQGYVLTSFWKNNEQYAVFGKGSR